LKIKESESIEAKKKIEKLRKDGVHITSDEQTNQVECEGTEAQVATARQVQQNFLPVKKIKYKKILTYILRSIFLKIPHLELTKNTEGYEW
jgi:hypothetical protein